MAGGSDNWRRRLRSAQHRLSEAGVEDARGKLRWLAAHLLECGLLDVERQGSDAPTPEQARMFSDGVERLLQHEPVQYVTGETDFLGMRIRCDRRALIPRPETEFLAQCALAQVQMRPGRPVVVDVGTGTGCLACFLALQAPRARVIATDVSADALDLARTNALALGAPVEFLHTDLLAGLPDGVADLVVSNPPYVAAEECERLSPTVRNFEPRLALDGGPDGLRVISRLVSESARVIVKSGWLLMEIGDDQAKAVQEMLCPTSQFNPVYLKSDYAGRARLVLAQKATW